MEFEKKADDGKPSVEQLAKALQHQKNQMMNSGDEVMNIARAIITIIAVGIILIFVYLASELSPDRILSQSKASNSRSVVRKAGLQRSGEPGQNLKGSDFSGKNIDKAYFAHAILIRSNFTGSKMLGANFSGCDCRKVDFTEAQMSKGKFAKANLKESTFYNANLSMADFRFANLHIADFTGATLKGVNFEGSDVRWTEFWGVKGLDIKELKKAVNWDSAFFDKRTRDKLGISNSAIASNLENFVQNFYKNHSPQSRKNYLSMLKRKYRVPQ